MKKYIIGLFSAICLMGAGCTEFEDFTPVDMGEGPAVTVTAEKTAVDAFKVTITPAEGTVYYSYIVTDEAMTVDPDQLLQAKYEGSTLVKAAEKPSVSGTLSNQNLGATYYVYAVASNEKGVCGAVASASVELPDEEAPYLVNVPDGNKYKATNGGRSVVLTFNETVVRGSGAITYDVTKGNLTSYASGTIESVAINNESVTITLPESVVFDENEAVSYVFLDFAEGAFADAGGNVSAALVGGVDEETQTVEAPYWEYTAAQESDFTGTFGFLFYQYDLQTQQPGSTPMGFDTEFSLKHANNPDTLVIDHFYFKDGYPNQLEAEVTDNGFRIADLQIMGVMQVETNVGMVNAIFTFAGLPESETDNFEYVNFAENAQGDEVVYAQDRWCGLYCFNADADPSDSNFSLGWYDLWNASLFFKGSVQAAAANTNIPSSIKLLKNEMKLSEMRPLSATEKLHMQSLIRQNLKMKSIR